MISCLQHAWWFPEIWCCEYDMVVDKIWFIVLFLKIFETKFENLWCDFFCQAVLTRLYDKLVKFNSLPFEVKMQCSVNLIIVLFLTYACLLLLACCFLAACLLLACCLWHFRHKTCLIMFSNGKRPKISKNRPISTIMSLKRYEIISLLTIKQPLLPQKGNFWGTILKIALNWSFSTVMWLKDVP